MSDAINLAHIRALVAAADPCEWSVHENRSDKRFRDVCTAHGAIVVEGVTKADAALIAEGKEWLGPLCDEVERLRAEVEQYLTRFELQDESRSKLEEENERLRGQIEGTQIGNDILHARIERAEQERDSSRDAAGQFAAAYDRVVAEKHAIERERDELRAALLSVCDTQLRITEQREVVAAYRRVANDAREPFSCERVDTLLATKEPSR